MEFGGSPAVIPLYQKILFVLLLVASLAMGVVLWQLRERAHQRLIAGQASAPTEAPLVEPDQLATLLIASDKDNSLLTQVHSLPLPPDPGARSRAVLGKLFDLYAAPDAAHAVPGGAASVTQVFLLPAEPLPAATPTQPIRHLPATPDSDTIRIKVPDSLPPALQAGPPLLAVVNLTSGFAASHPSGIQTETLTILSICATLHANLPRVTQVRFLVDGLERPTLAGHADLTRTYLAGDAAPAESPQP
jgi:hypothetical protein